ncbi:transposase [Nocardioides taihuensis]|uniref:Transposase n=1 Tax=Nocardioides taihuensis TaxID=1835606 RepID=A0ABW0BGU0_9ACTN
MRWRWRPTSTASPLGRLTTWLPPSAWWSRWWWSWPPTGDLRTSTPVWGRRGFRTIIARPEATTVAATWDGVHEQLAKPWPKIGPLMDDAKTGMLAFTGFPRSHGDDLIDRPLGASERGNQAPRPRRRDLPNDAAATHLVGAILAPPAGRCLLGEPREWSSTRSTSGATGRAVRPRGRR